MRASVAVTDATGSIFTLRLAAVMLLLKPGRTDESNESILTVCTNPQLRVETQVFLVVNDQNALNYRETASCLCGRLWPLITLPPSVLRLADFLAKLPCASRQ